MNGLSFLHLELTSRCNKSCWMCGRRKMEREYPELCNWGDMEKEMVYEIYTQMRRLADGNCTIQFHNNGEPLLYPELGSVLSLFKGFIRCFNTNGLLLRDKADDLIGNFETLTISVIQDDPEGEEQYEIVHRFLNKKSTRKPFMVYRLLGKIENEEAWKALPGVIARRILHSPMGSFNYQKTPTIPEIGVCTDILTHLAINRFGDISLCVRFDPKGELKIGNIKEISLEEAWSSPKRKEYLRYHIEGKRSQLPGCSRCEYWGIPRGE